MGFKKLIVLVFVSFFMAACSTVPSTSSINIDNIYPKLVTNELLDEAVQKGHDSYVLMNSSSGKTYFVPSINRDIPSQLIESKDHHSILVEPFIDGLSVIYVIDHGDFSQILSNSHLKVLGITKLELQNLIDNNLYKYSKNKKRKNIQFSNTKSGAVLIDGNYESSLILSKKFINEISESVEGDLIVYLAASRTFIYADSKDLEGVKTASSYMLNFNKELPNPLLKYGLVLKNGKWVAK